MSRHRCHIMSLEGGQSDQNCSDWPRTPGTFPIPVGLSQQLQSGLKVGRSILCTVPYLTRLTCIHPYGSSFMRYKSSSRIRAVHALTLKLDTAHVKRPRSGLESDAQRMVKARENEAVRVIRNLPVHLSLTLKRGESMRRGSGYPAKATNSHGYFFS